MGRRPRKATERSWQFVLNPTDATLNHETSWISFQLYSIFYSNASQWTKGTNRQAHACQPLQSCRTEPEIGVQSWHMPKTPLQSLIAIFAIPTQSVIIQQSSCNCCTRPPWYIELDEQPVASLVNQLHQDCAPTQDNSGISDQKLHENVSQLRIQGHFHISSKYTPQHPEAISPIVVKS